MDGHKTKTYFGGETQSASQEPESPSGGVVCLIGGDQTTEESVRSAGQDPDMFTMRVLLGLMGQGVKERVIARSSVRPGIPEPT